MRKLLAHKAMLLTLVFAGVWSTPTYAANRQIHFPLPTHRTFDERARLVTGEVWVRTELFFGSAKPDGSFVTEKEFREFLDNQITPRFPDGLTLLTGTGQFRGSNGIIVQERSMLLILLYPLNMRDGNKKIEEIREAYRRDFQQESVLRADSLTRISF